MTALSARTIDPNRIDPASWLRATDAADRMGKNRGSLRQRCISELCGQGLAIKMKVPGDRNECWWVHRSIDPQLANHAELDPQEDSSEPIPEMTPLQVLDAAPAKKRDEAESKARSVMLFREWRSRGGSVTHEYDVFLARCKVDTGREPTLRTIYRWDRQAEKATNFTDAAVALLDGRTRGPVSTSCDQECWDLFESKYLSKNKPGISWCYRFVEAWAKEHGLSWPSMTTVRQMMKKRISPERACYHREGEHDWQTRFNQPVEQDPDRYAPGERWESDHSTMDCYVRRLVRGEWKWCRPHLCTWFDWKTRLVVGWHLSFTPDAESVRTAFISAIRHPDWTPPRNVLLDNGRAFVNKQITGATRYQRFRGEGDLNQGLLGHCSIDVQLARPGNHNAKARIERSYGMMHEEVCKPSGSYCGSKPGDVDKAEIARLLKDPSKLPTLDEIRVRLTRFFEWHNIRTDHSYPDLRMQDGTRVSPMEAYMTGVMSRLPISEKLIRRLERSWYGPFNVTKRGVSFLLDSGTRVSYHDHRMRPLVGAQDQIYVTVGDDVSVCMVHDHHGRELFAAKEVELHNGTDRAALKAALKRQRDAKRAAKVKPDIDALVLSKADLVFQEQRKREVDESTARIRQLVPDVPANFRFHEAPVDGDPDEIEAAERRLAAGGEGDPVERFDLADLARDDDDDDVAEPFALSDLGDDDDDDDHVDLLGALCDD